MTGIHDACGHLGQDFLGYLGCWEASPFEKSHKADGWDINGKGNENQGHVTCPIHLRIDKYSNLDRYR